MCLSLIQENVSLYSSYFIKREEEDTELDVIIPSERIPNWIGNSESSDTDSESSITDEGSDKDESQSGIVGGIAVGFMPGENELKSSNNISVSDLEEYDGDGNSVDHNKDESSEERSEEDYSNSSNSSSSSSSNSNTDVDDEDSSEEEGGEKVNDME